MTDAPTPLATDAAAVPGEPGRRERKKAQTRRALADAALRLFLERGFDQVTVAEIAAAADTAVTTLFKHFPDGKTALVFEEDAQRAAVLTAAVRERPAGTSVLAALRAFMAGRGVFEPHPSPEQARLIGLITTTPELRAYARVKWVRCEGPLTEVLAEELGGSPDDAGLRALARFVLEIPELTSGAPDPLAALHTVFDHLERGWGAPAGR